MTVNPIGFSYIRFSGRSQEKGDSVRRQDGAVAVWCKRNKVRLDTSTTLRDLGKSAYLGEHRKNPDRHALAGFLKMVEDGKVPRGSYLIVENLDRLYLHTGSAGEISYWVNILQTRRSTEANLAVGFLASDEFYVTKVPTF